ncbi:DUF3320 domain-containing protein [Streptomyces sp. NPDC048483]|uniref:DUF3320 domain-containing protein n=1 Tax=Streptomyces sp. NPDC048483 TaxID=3154927 RepID=UPI003442D0F8
MYETCGTAVSSPYELHTQEAHPALRRLLADLTGVEGPIHEELLVQRARAAWGLARAGRRIRDNVHTGARSLARAGKAAVRGDFVDVAHRDELKARTPDGEGTSRKAAHVASPRRSGSRRCTSLRLSALECRGTN